MFWTFFQNKIFLKMFHPYNTLKFSTQVDTMTFLRDFQEIKCWYYKNFIFWRVNVG
jgi:hypothetical protein